MTPFFTAMSPTLTVSNQKLPFGNIPINKVGYAFDIYDSSGNHIPHIINWSNTTTFNIYRWNGISWTALAGVPDYDSTGTRPSDLWDIFFDTTSENSNNFSLIGNEEYQNNTQYYNDLFGMYIKDFFRIQTQNNIYYAANTTSLNGIVEQWKIYLNNVGTTNRVQRHSTKYFPTETIVSSGSLTEQYLAIPPYPANPPSAIDPGIPIPIDSNGISCKFDPMGCPRNSIVPYTIEDTPVNQQIPGPLGLTDPLNKSHHLGPSVRERKKDGLWWTLLVLQNIMADLNNLVSAQSNEISAINDQLTSSLKIENAISAYSQAMQSWINAAYTDLSKKKEALTKQQSLGEERRNLAKQQRTTIQQQSKAASNAANISKDAMSNVDQLQNKIRETYFNTNSIISKNLN